MKVVRKKPGEGPEIIDIENTLEALQSEVGGYIEACTFCTDACVICNAEGRLEGMSHNVKFLGYDFVGTILIVGTKGDEFCDVPNPELFIKSLYSSWLKGAVESVFGGECHDN